MTITDYENWISSIELFSTRFSQSKIQFKNELKRSSCEERNFIYISIKLLSS